MMLTLGLAASTLTLLLGALTIGRLHLLSASLAALRHLVEGKQAGEVEFLRRQIEQLQQQVLATSFPAAQARLKAQAAEGELGRFGGAIQQRPSAEVIPMPPRRNPMLIEVPESMSAHDSLQGGYEDDTEAADLTTGR